MSQVRASRRAGSSVHGEQGISFEAFYAAELPRLVALAYSLCGPLAAEDVAQDAMLVAYRRWRQISDLERPDLWVRRTCANLAVSHFRRRLAEARATSRNAGRRQLVPELTATTAEFWTAVRRLPRRQAQAAALRFVYDLSIKDIAITLGCTEGSVKQHLSRARRSLADELGLVTAPEEVS